MLVTRLLLAVAVGVCLAACSSEGTTKTRASPPPTAHGVKAGNTPNARLFNGAGPWNICGQQIALTAAGFHVDDASDHDVMVTQTSAPGALYLLLSHDCDADVHYQVDPAGAATVIAASPSAKPVAIVLQPVAQTFAVTFRRSSGTGRVTVDLAQPTTSLHQ